MELADKQLDLHLLHTAIKKHLQQQEDLVESMTPQEHEVFHRAVVRFLRSTGRSDLIDEQDDETTSLQKQSNDKSDLPATEVSQRRQPVQKWEPQPYYLSPNDPFRMNSGREVNERISRIQDEERQRNYHRRRLESLEKMRTENLLRDSRLDEPFGMNKYNVDQYIQNEMNHSGRMLNR